MLGTRIGAAAALGIIAAMAGGQAMENEWVPGDAPADAVMASPEDVGRMGDWARAVFLGVEAPAGAGRVELELVRQDYNVLRFGESCMETPIIIGSRKFAHGLGTHANSEIVVHLPEGARRFKAFAGIDNNYDTGGVRGTVQFAVEIGGAEIVRTPTLHGGDDPFPVSVDIPEGTDTLVLKVDTTEDGPSHDQSDWADACLEMADGRTLWLDEGQREFFLNGESAPFSFVYGGKASGELLPGWERTLTMEDEGDCVKHVATWADPGTGLRVVAELKVFKRYGAAEWLLRFENGGTADSPILEDIQALDAGLRTGNSKQPVLLRRNLGDSCGPQSFLNVEDAVAPGGSARMAPRGGRSSSGAFPFFGVRFGADTLIAAVGWTGQWAVTLDRSDAGPGRLRAGMEHTHLLLHPGESIRTPRILLLWSKGDVQTAHNQFRRLMLFHYVPQSDGKPLALPAVLQTFDRYRLRPGWATEAGQLEGVRFAHEAGFDAWWFDAAWFPGEFPGGVGNWYAKPEAFPKGLKPVGEACREAGMKFVLWFEPERVGADTQIAREHPEFVFGGTGGGLFKLHEPEARAFLTELLSQRITEYGIDVYRNDFNIDPLPFWRGNDAADREGMTEIRYIEGLYAMWDELLARHPGMFIDNCASGGRRIDLEMCSRSVPLWRSDTNCSPGHCHWNQDHAMGIGQYVPLHTACAWTPEVYEMRSDATAGLVCQWAYLEEGFPIEEAKRALAEAKAHRKYWYGDLYPLTAAIDAPGQWRAFQLHRADLNEGIVLAFRREDSDYTAMAVRPHALEADTAYRLEAFEEDGASTGCVLSGRELMEGGYELRIGAEASSVVVRYAPAANGGS